MLTPPAPPLDGTTGTCSYTRYGPGWHLFQYQHPGRSGSVPIAPSTLPRQYLTSHLENTPVGIALKAQELAEMVYEAAIQTEQKDRFRRALPPSGHTIDPTACQISAKRAKEIGGKYALCVQLGENLIPSSDLFATLNEANAAWKERGNRSLRVACACRWSRRWELPRFNALYAEIDVQIDP